MMKIQENDGGLVVRIRHCAKDDRVIVWPELETKIEDGIAFQELDFGKFGRDYAFVLELFQGTEWQSKNQVDHDELQELRAKVKELEETIDVTVGERDRLAIDALHALAAARIPTPEKGFIPEPQELKPCIERLAKRSDENAAECEDLRAIRNAIRREFDEFKEDAHNVIGGHSYWRDREHAMREICKEALEHCRECVEDLSEETPVRMSMNKAFEELGKLESDMANSLFAGAHNAAKDNLAKQIDEGGREDARNRKRRNPVGMPDADDLFSGAGRGDDSHRPVAPTLSEGEAIEAGAPEGQLRDGQGAPEEIRAGALGEERLAGDDGGGAEVPGRAPITSAAELDAFVERPSLFRRGEEESDESFRQRMIDAIAIAVEPSGRYDRLEEILERAQARAQDGKGADRHDDGQPFENQPLLRIIGEEGLGYPFGQVRKKLQEARIRKTEDAVNELLDAIVHLAAAIIALEDGRAPCQGILVR